MKIFQIRFLKLIKGENMDKKIKIILLIIIFLTNINIYAEKTAGIRIMMDLNTMIPLEQNAYNLLWGIQWLESLGGRTGGMVIGLRIYYGSANASVKIEGEVAKIFGLYDQKNYLKDDATFRFFTSPDVKIFNAAFLMGACFKTWNFFEQEQYVNLLFGITIIDREHIYARFVDEGNKIQAGTYSGYLDPEITIEIISKIQSFWFVEKPYVKVAYGIRIVEAISNIRDRFEMVNYIRVGIGVYE